MVDLEYTHGRLIELGAGWLRKEGWPVVATDIVSAASESPDVIGFKSSGSVVLEAKASRADFLSDRKKRFRARPEEGMGDARYYVCPNGLVELNDLPESVLDCSDGVGFSGGSS